MMSDLALPSITEIAEVAKPLLNSNSLYVVQVLATPVRENPFPEVYEIRRPSLLGLVIRQQFSLAVMVSQIFKRHQSRCATATPSTVDSGTLSLTVGTFTASACYGNSTNPLCSGQPVNIYASDVAVALAQAFNVSSSPVTATASADILSLTLKTPGPFAPSVSPLVTSHDNPSVFTTASFTTQPTAFSGGQYPPFDNANSYATLYSYDALGNLLCVEQHGGVSGTGCSSPPSSDPTSPWRVRRFTYDSLSRLLTADNPSQGISYTPTIMTAS